MRQTLSPDLTPLCLSGDTKGHDTGCMWPDENSPDREDVSASVKSEQDWDHHPFLRRPPHRWLIFINIHSSKMEFYDWFLFLAHFPWYCFHLLLGHVNGSQLFGGFLFSLLLFFLKFLGQLLHCLVLKIFYSMGKQRSP